jgi:Ion transport protein
MPNLANFSLLLLIFQIVFVIIGMQFFSGTVFLNADNQIVPPGQGIPPLNNFETLYNATTTVFAVMMNDNWHSIMFEYYKSKGVAAQAYFIITIIVLNTMMMNLFLALILENFENETRNHDNKDDEEIKVFTNL